MKRYLLICAMVVACSDEPASDPDMGPDVATAGDVGTTATDSDAPDTREGPDTSSGPLEVGEYCETTVDMFCDYYVRCGRIAATDLTDCRAKFLETCNAVFEPQYIALADRGQLRLSAAGIEQCAAHLAGVDCSRHIFDLDGPCRAVWEGQASAGQPCAPGVGVFVCEAGTECVLDLSLCGTCEPAGDVDSPCVDGRCDRESTCIADTCVARGLPGDSCDDDRICATGLSCAEGVCSDYAIASVGGSCASARCPYQSTCLQDVCVADARNGDSCAAGEVCGSGTCDGETCQPFRTGGAACGDNAECLSGRCENAVCAPTISMCF